MPDSVRFHAPLKGVRIVRQDEVEWEARLQEEKTLAYRQGYDDASHFLQEQLMQQRSDVLHLKDEVFRHLLEQEEVIIREARDVIPLIALDIVKRILSGVELSAEAIKANVEEAIEELAPEKSNLEISLAEKDLALLKKYEGELKSGYPNLVLRADPKLVPGDCLVKSRFGLVDARLSTKLKAVANCIRS